MQPIRIDPALDLVLERTLDVPAELVWKAWTTPAILQRFFCPEPWGVSKCEIDLRPGGRFHTTMRSPEGQEFPNEGCFLEVVPGRRLVWTDSLQAGWRPAARGFLTDGPGGFYMTGVLELQDLGGGRTRYFAASLHRNGDDRDAHAKMGFEQGWGIVCDQMVALIKKGI